MKSNNIFNRVCVLALIFISCSLLCSSGAFASEIISPTTDPLFGLTYSSDKGLFIAVGGSGTILTSSDGDTWSQQTSGTSEWLNGIAYGNGVFVAIGDFGTILTSSDGTHWILLDPSAIKPYSTTHHLDGITFGNNIFVAVGTLGAILTSTDGASWTNRTTGSDYLHGVVYGNNSFVAVGGSGAVLTSPDGATWTERTSGTFNYLEGVAYGNNTFVAVGAYGTILTSPDGSTWTSISITPPINYHLYGVIYDSADGEFIAVGEAGTILTSADGVAWTLSLSETTYSLYGLTYGDNIVVAAGENGTILRTPKGSIAINSGAAYTSSVSVTLSLSCDDFEGNVCKKMKFSNDNIDWSTPEDYVALKTWTLLSGDGTKAVYARFMDNWNNWSSIYADSIFLDTTAPAVAASPAGGIFDTGQSVALTWNDGTGSGCDKIYYTTDGSMPTTGSSVYAAPIYISSNTTLNFFAKDKAGNSSSVRTENYVISPAALIITTSSLPSGIPGDPYSQTLAAAGGVTPYSWSIVSGNLPSGLTLNSSTGVISGTPTLSGVSNFAVQVTDAHSSTTAESFSINIQTSAARTAGATPVYFDTLQAAYNASVNGDVIQIQALTFTENLNCNNGTSITLEGGYDADYTTNASSYTTITGSLTITTGTVVVENIIIK